MLRGRYKLVLLWGTVAGNLWEIRDELRPRGQQSGLLSVFLSVGLLTLCGLLASSVILPRAV